MPDNPAVDRERDEARWRLWMTQAQNGDADAYRMLLDQLYEVIGAYVRRILGDAPLVEDCVQDCLLAIHGARHTYDARRPFRPWLLTIVRHKAIDSLRRAGQRARHEADVPAQPPPAATPRPDRQLDAERLLDRLAPAYREAVVLTKLEGYSAAEAAARMGISTSALKTRVSRGLRALGRLLSEDEQRGPA